MSRCLASLPGQTIELSGTRDKVNKSGTVPEIPGQLEPMGTADRISNYIQILAHLLATIVEEKKKKKKKMMNNVENYIV